MTDKQINFVEWLQDAPVIAAVKNDEGLEKALVSDCAAIFFLYGTILNIAQLIEKAKQNDKLVFVHTDLIEGLTGKDISIDFIAQKTRADGVISTRINLIRHAKKLGLIAIQRFFLLDSLAFENIRRQALYADAVDILPGTMPRVIERLSHRVHQPIIASGLITDKQDIISALSAGALAVSTTSMDLWFV